MKLLILLEKIWTWSQSSLQPINNYQDWTICEQKTKQKQKLNKVTSRMFFKTLLKCDNNNLNQSQMNGLRKNATYSTD